MKSDETAADSPFQLFRLIGRLRAEFVNGIESEMARQDIELNFTQFLALKLLGDQNEPMTPVELARALHYNPGALTRLLDKLEQHGYLRRVPDSKDRRALRLELSAAGKALRKRTIACCSATAERAFACTGERERGRLRSALARVLDHMQGST